MSALDGLLQAGNLTCLINPEQADSLLNSAILHAHAHTHTFKQELENPFRMTNKESEPTSVCDFTEDVGCMTQVRGPLHSVM